MPIAEFVNNMPSRRVLTVNQVIEIAVQWIDHKDWEKAFYAVIPQRKFAKDKPTDVSKTEDPATVEAEEVSGNVNVEEAQTEADTSIGL